MVELDEGELSVGVGGICWYQGPAGGIADSYVLFFEVAKGEAEAVVIDAESFS